MKKNNTVKRVFSAIDDLLRIVTMAVVLTPASIVLPRRWALFIADICALLLLVSPRSGRPAYFQFRQAFGRGRVGTLMLTWQWLRQPYRDFVILKRVINRREDPTTWQITEKNSAAIDELRNSGKSYIVATAHFLREALHTPFISTITPGHAIWISIDVPKRIQTIKDLRFRVQFGALMQNLDGCGRYIEMRIIGESSVKDLVRRLRDKGNVLFISIDAPWRADQPGAHCRDFAGEKRRAFPTGAAKIARLARCPVIACVISVDDQGGKVLEWGDPIYPDKKGDIEIIDDLLDTMEIAVGERPSQYVLPIGGGRRWNAPDRRWEG
jgi:lauroyl/myristoyl acyltransferase